MAAEMRVKPVLTGENARKFIEREKQVNDKRQNKLKAGDTPRINRGFSLWTLQAKN
ncbi:MAG TPA: hypothetical protein GX723_02025 [Thermoanaerobacterales bacterium]|jgi:hypothetical protein|nr:hypothetical protein [Thermoanaerobacterales bacterium]